MKLLPDQKLFVWDAESVGLHGTCFAVGGGIYDLDGTAIEEFAFHLFDPRASSLRLYGVRGRAEEDAKWVSENVRIAGDSLRCGSLANLFTRFWNAWRKAVADHPGILMLVECGWPVEARFLIECVNQDPLVRNWEGPYPLHEIATLMLAAGMDPMATYERQENELPAHEPRADARLSARLAAKAIRILSARSELAETEGCM